MRDNGLAPFFWLLFSPLCIMQRILFTGCVEFIQDCNVVCSHDTAFTCGDVHYALTINQSIKNKCKGYDLLRIGLWWGPRLHTNSSVRPAKVFFHNVDVRLVEVMLWRIVWSLFGCGTVIVVGSGVALCALMVQWQFWISLTYYTPVEYFFSKIRRFPLWRKLSRARVIWGAPELAGPLFSFGQ